MVLLRKKMRMNTELKSLLDLLGLPDVFGETLLVLSLILALAPYFSGFDFGVIKIPQFSDQWRRRLKWIGPLAIVFMVALHVPFYDANHQPLSQPESPTEKIDTLQTQKSDSVDQKKPPANKSDSLQSSQPKPPHQKTIADTIENTGQNMVEAEIVEKVISGVPKRTESFSTVIEQGENTLVGLVTVKARIANFIPVTYLLEWVLITPEGKSILLDSYRGNDKYQFTQRSDALITPYWVNKTIWTDNPGTYKFKVYTSELQLVAEASIIIE
jgi:hypothetical protein